MQQPQDGHNPFASAPGPADQPFPPPPRAVPPYLARPVPPARPTRTYGLGVVLLSAGVAAVLAGSVGLGLGALLASVGGDERDDLFAADPGSDNGSDPDARPATEVLPERLPELLAWVEQRVGVTFTTPPDVEAMDDDAFEDALMEPSPDAGEPQSLPADDYTSTVHALGLVPDVDDYEDFYDTGYASGVVGFYDSGTQRLAVRGSEWTPLVEVTVVHELVHALQDQAVDLDAVTDTTRLEDETYLALTSVIEGQATVVENDWLAEQTGDYQDRYAEEISSGGGGGAYDAFAATMSYLPYDLGLLAVGELEAAESPAVTLQVLADPPTTTEQLFALPAWRAGETAEADPQEPATPTPPDDAELVDEGTLGVYVLALLDEDSAAWGYAEDVDPIQGWTGDRYATWTTDDDGTCTAVVVQMDDAAAATQLADDLDGWTSSDRTLTTDGSRLDLLACVDD